MNTPSQNLFDYLPGKIESIKYDPIQLKKDYLVHYFSPWTQQQQIMQDNEIKHILLDVIEHHKQHRGYALTRKQHNAKWVNDIANNADLDYFPNVNQPGIAIFDTEARLLPTSSPSFKDIHSQWDGYPFDDIQQSYLTAGTPIRVLHHSKDHAWLLILTDGFFGWVKSETIAYVSTEFISRFQTTEYVMSLKDKIVSFKQLSQLPISLRIGNIYPLKESTADHYVIYLPTVDDQRNAVLKSIQIHKQALTPFPLPITLENIASIGNQMLGNPYGWGGICGYRDCSSTLADLMSTFAIWLPRNSKAQIEAGTSFSLKEIDSAEKLQFINKHSVDFLTILYTPGHIVLYLGEKNGIPYIYQSASRCYGTVITPLEFQLKEERNKTLLEEVTQMRVLTSLHWISGNN
jgi:hypothetical protein